MSAPVARASPSEGTCEVIDFHVHVWRSRRDLPAIIWDTFPGVRRQTDYVEAAGRPEYFEQHVWPGVWDPDGSKLLASMDEAGVDRAVVMPMDFGLALGDDTMTSIEEKNEGLAAIASRQERLVSFVGVDPRRPKALEIIDIAVNQWGAKGIKLYPPTGWYPDDRRHYGVYELAGTLGVPVAFHTGTARYPLKGLTGHPMHIDAVAADFPDLTIVMLHGSWNFNWMEEAVAFAALKPNLHIELGGWQDLLEIRPSRFMRMLADAVTRLGAERILFGSDHTGLRRNVGYRDWLAAFTGHSDAADELGFAMTPEEVELVVGGNAARILNLPAEEDQA